MTSKISYTSDLIPYAEALALFESEQDLINALKRGRVMAYGRICYNLDEPGVLSGIMPISAMAWIDYEFKDGMLFGGVDPQGSSDPIEISQIYIELSTIQQFQRHVKQQRGRAPLYDWDSFWRAIAFHVLTAEHKDEPIPASLRDWARNAHSMYDYLWTDTSKPSETSLEDKLRPLLEAINKDSDEPLREFVLKSKAASGGK